MTVDIIQEHDSVVLVLEGRLDGNSSPDVELAFARLLEQRQSRFVFDCAALQYISSAGLRVVLTAAKKLKSAQGKLALCQMSEPVKEVFEMAGLHTILTILPTRGEALTAIRA